MRRLSRLEPGQRATIEEIMIPEALERRLRDFGLVKGTGVVCRYVSPDKALAALELRGTVLALRRKDLTGIRVLIYD